MSYLLQEAELEPGQRVVRLKTVQRLGGLGTHIAAVNQALGTELGALDALMCQPDGPAARAMPRGGEEGQEVAWQ
eukprot:8990941-Pyramimonas_sp.AAC.1